ncbi:MAG: prolyl oligopeptidase family serine peptidase, partial [Myxococcota bacterium]|nr:prolyl oligopeptidase family serine peptidase [Myxococcota bacterium]
LVDPTHPERAPDVWPYPRPGGTHADVTLGLVSARGGRTTWIAWDRATYPYLAAVRWDEGAPLTLLVQNRTQTEEALLTVDPKRGTTEILHVERDAAWLNIDQSVPRWLPEGAGFLWSTEREGAWQLERRDAKGQLVGALTSADLGYRRLLHHDPRGGVAYVVASDDPTQDQVWRVTLGPDGASPTAMTRSEGHHRAVFGEETDLWVQVSTDLTGPRRWQVRRGPGAPLGELVSVAEAPPFAPNVTLTQVQTGERTLHAALIRPRNFEASRRYPVLLHVYGGPHGRMVSHQGRRYLLDQWMADHGVVVVCIDGRGTPHRGRAFERVIQGNLVDIPLGDQVAGLQALGAAHPELDLDRVGIFGWSFGGYLSAMAVMRRPDVFKVGVAGAPVTDWRDYDTHYTERYLGHPGTSPEAYERTDLCADAASLTRPLLLIHGMADDNVVA